ncbi:putative MFS family arabinose efflux permease [Pararhizobium capsulatum DSM 1112]|uniref:MFS family arabinose efflux permease n=1 Tax=Pararhizobium capsulatum DSM 1112 TaxID=1121113 RepID=A0ABU0BJF3_9HYPH|nr:putative MFS family arabinose efflux permease [Pararhizobium capsulatum DSM 1112]
MATITAVDAAQSPPASLSPSMTFLLAAACGLIAANLYYAQPLIGLISSSLGLTPAAAGLIVTLTQIGYGLGLLLIVPLGDLFENRRLILVITGLGTLAVVAAGLANTPMQFLAAALFIGIGSVAVQIIVPYAAHMVAEEHRGATVGNVMSGLMVGIMLARPVSSFIAEFLPWHSVFFISAAVLVALMVVLGRALPDRVPKTGLGYGALLTSMGRLVVTTPILRRRALYQACLFGAFSLFWTTTPLLLSGPEFGLSQGQIALFALAGAAGAVAAPIAGRMADRGWSYWASRAAMASVAVAFLITHIAPTGSMLALVLLTFAAILLDFGVTTNLVLGQRAIFVLGPEYRSRLNGLYMATFFAGGAIGSAVGAWLYADGGWWAASTFGLALPLTALAYSLTEGRDKG